MTEEQKRTEPEQPAPEPQGKGEILSIAFNVVMVILLVFLRGFIGLSLVWFFCWLGVFFLINGIWTLLPKGHSIYKREKGVNYGKLMLIGVIPAFALVFWLYLR